MIDGNQFDTFYHEHPRTYSYGSFVQIATTLDTQLIDVEFPSRYGGNIRVFLGNSKNSDYIGNVDLSVLELREKKFFDDFSEGIGTIMEFYRCFKGTKGHFCIT